MPNNETAEVDLLGDDIESEWREALHKDFDPEYLKSLKDRHVKAMRRSVNWGKAYILARSEYQKFRDERMRELQEEYEPMTKLKLSEVSGLRMERYTKKQMIDHLVNFRLSEVESEHVRVKRIWAAMSDEEKER